MTYTFVSSQRTYMSESQLNVLRFLSPCFHIKATFILAMPTSRLAHILSNSDKSEMLALFEIAEHQHLQAILAALVNDPELGVAVLHVMKRDVLPSMEIDETDLRMVARVDRLCNRWDVIRHTQEVGHLALNPPTKSLRDSQVIKHPHTERPGTLVHADSVCSVDDFLHWSVNPEPSTKRPQLPAPRLTKKRKIRDNSTRPQKIIAAASQQDTPAPPLSNRAKSSTERNSKGAARPPTRSAAHKENEKAVPLDAVVKRVLQRSSGVTDILQAAFTVRNEATFEGAQPSRPENPVASVLAGRDCNVAPLPRCISGTPKPIVPKKATARPVLPLQDVLATERKTSLRLRTSHVVEENKR